VGSAWKGLWNELWRSIGILCSVRLIGYVVNVQRLVLHFRGGILDEGTEASDF
jgi:hypothetical protein